MSACACIGPLGDCPCIRLGKGVAPEIYEVYTDGAVWEHLTLEEKQTINEMKLAATMRLLLSQSSSTS